MPSEAQLLMLDRDAVAAVMTTIAAGAYDGEGFLVWLAARLAE